MNYGEIRRASKRSRIMIKVIRNKEVLRLIHRIQETDKRIKDVSPLNNSQTLNISYFALLQYTKTLLLERLNRINK